MNGVKMRISHFYFNLLRRQTTRRNRDTSEERVMDNKKKGPRHWESRGEPGWKGFAFNQPYRKGLDSLRRVMETTDYDPAVLWQWGTMQSLAVIEILKSVERKFGRDGQQVVFESLWRVGYDIGKQITDGTDIPEGMSDAEWISFYATVINRIAYASLETPKIEDGEHVSFNIDWCPHQDVYGAFDCRVQRYFVQGMIDAAKDFVSARGHDAVWDVAFKTTIPSGGETCYFELYRGDPEKSRKWAEYTKVLEEKALEIARSQKK